eukprot:1158119-Pelagomonas_calceolata.AAC.2
MHGHSKLVAHISMHLQNVTLVVRGLGEKIKAATYSHINHKATSCRTQCHDKVAGLDVSWPLLRAATKSLLAPRLERDNKHKSAIMMMSSTR